MAVAVELEFTGSTLEQYDQALEKMGFVHSGSGGPGMLFHLVRKTDTGFHVTDVWETREQFQTFAESTLGPIGMEVGMPNQPTIEIHEIYNYLAQRS